MHALRSLRAAATSLSGVAPNRCFRGGIRAYITGAAPIREPPQHADVFPDRAEAMPICSYLVVPTPSRGAAVRAALAALDGCEAVLADNHEVIALVTDTPSDAEEQALRRALETVADVQAMVLTFGQLESRAGHA
jgi:nitrate reductase NapAB chaperone NapD